MLHFFHAHECFSEERWSSSEEAFPEALTDKMKRILPGFELALEMTPVLKTVLVREGPLSAKVGVAFPFEVQLAFEAGQRRFRKARDTGRDRRILYRTIEHGLGQLGLDGRACVLRAVCEAAQHPINEDGLFGEVLSLLLK